MKLLDCETICRRWISMALASAIHLCGVAFLIIASENAASAAPASKGELREIQSYPKFIETTRRKPGPRFVPVLDAYTKPKGLAGFCDQHPSECSSWDGGTAEVRLTPALWQTLVTINRFWNQRIHAITDRDHWGVEEKWSIPTDNKGDCEDFVLMKRSVLISSGIPPETLLITTVKQKKENDGHAVLIVKTDVGDLILDNQEENILHWSDSARRYHFKSRQTQASILNWVSLANEPSDKANTTSDRAWLKIERERIKKIAAVQKRMAARQETKQLDDLLIGRRHARVDESAILFEITQEDRAFYDFPSEIFGLVVVKDGEKFKQGEVVLNLTLSSFEAYRKSPSISSKLVTVRLLDGSQVVRYLPMRDWGEAPKIADNNEAGSSRAAEMRTKPIVGSGVDRKNLQLAGALVYDLNDDDKILYDLPDELKGVLIASSGVALTEGEVLLDVALADIEADLAAGLSSREVSLRGRNGTIRTKHIPLRSYEKKTVDKLASAEPSAVAVQATVAGESPVAPVAQNSKGIPAATPADVAMPPLEALTSELRARRSHLHLGGILFVEMNSSDRPLYNIPETVSGLLVAFSPPTASLRQGEVLLGLSLSALESAYAADSAFLEVRVRTIVGFEETRSLSFRAHGIDGKDKPQHSASNSNTPAVAEVAEPNNGKAMTPDSPKVGSAPYDHKKTLSIFDRLPPKPNPYFYVAR